MLSTTFFNSQNRKNSTQKLSLVALMDIFTILVFFLLLNSGEAQKIENARFVNLPDSIKGELPHGELLIFIESQKIWLDDVYITEVKDELSNKKGVIKSLNSALKEHTQKFGKLTSFEEKEGLSITIMGDKKIPYNLLKRIMSTCRKQNFRNISLAVNRVTEQDNP